MECWQFSQWCRRATSKIIYPPDRKAVFEELRQHMDERSDLFLDQGFSEQDSVEKTLSVMGNADDLAKQLGAIHRPFWGFAWSITKWISAIAIILMLATVLIYRVPMIGSVLIQNDSLNSENWDPYLMTENFSLGQQVMHQELQSEYSEGYYTITLTDAALWKNTDGENLFFRLRIGAFLPWADTPGFMQYLSAKDSLGNEHPISSSENLRKSGLFTWTYDGVISQPFAENVQWIDICYDKDGRTMSLRIYLNGGV